MKLKYSRKFLTDALRGALRGHPGVRIASGVKMKGHGTYALERGSQIARGARIYVGPGATLTLGKGSKIGARNLVNVVDSLTIGRSVRMSWDIQVMDTDFHWLRGGSGRVNPPQAPIVIHDRVLVGASSMILKGVTIGEGAVVGAASVVRRDVAPGSVVIGNPATQVGTALAWGTGTPPDTTPTPG